MGVVSVHAERTPDGASPFPKKQSITASNPMTSYESIYKYQKRSGPSKYMGNEFEEQETTGKTQNWA